MANQTLDVRTLDGQLKTFTGERLYYVVDDNGFLIITDESGQLFTAREWSWVHRYGVAASDVKPVAASVDGFGFRKYRRKAIAELRPYVAGEALTDRVSVSAADTEAGSPKLGDMIARNPVDHSDQWLVAREYFEMNFTEFIDESGGGGLTD